MTFRKQSPIVARVEPSPNFGERAGDEPPNLIVLHYTGMRDADTALRWLLSPASQVSCHYFVGEDGEVLQLVREEHRAWHAGKSAWKGITDINSASIGIEIVNPGHEWGYRDFPRVQMDAVAELCADIVSRRAISRRNVLAHSDVAPLRKEDPGERFDWRGLAAKGVGLWVPPAPIRRGRSIARGDGGARVEALQAMLALHGYAIEAGGQFDEATEAVVKAFQRHFRQARVDGIADRSTVDTLSDVIAAGLAAGLAAGSAAGLHES